MNVKKNRPATCPPWCEMGHGIHLGEEDQVHISRQLCVRNTLMRLCATIDPGTGEMDGPYVLMGTQEFDLGEVDALIAALTQLAEDAKGSFVPQQLERTLPVTNA
jgi:hypothetical protein